MSTVSANPPAAPKFRYRLEKRKEIGLLANLLSILVALICSFGLTFLVIAMIGADAKTVLWAIVKGSFGTKNALIDTLIKATPIFITGLATVVAYRARVWNIGQEGQLYAGALGTTWAALLLKETALPAWALIPLLLIVAVLCGGLAGAIPGVLKARYNVNEIIVTVMLNYITLYLTTYLLGGVWQEPGSHYYNTIRFPEASNLPLLFGSRLHIGFLIALLLAGLIYYLLWRMKLGYEIRAVGHNPTAARFKGINPRRITLVVMLLSGAICGLAGGVELLGVHHRLVYGFSVGFGFTGILIALLGRLHPLGVAPAAIFFGALHNGSSAMIIHSNVPRELITAIMGFVILMLLFWEAVFYYRLRRVEDGQ
ncbi:MAG: ABC transporter permease [Chloroflexi bacterium]|nr:ABC transporter permease [Chloroflexota bacterium]